MKIKTIHLAYYSATFTTRRIMRAIAESFGEAKVKEYDITGGTVSDDVTLSGDGDVLIVGVPSYAGRVPQMAVAPISRFIGSDTPAIGVCVYGNRAFDDTLIELQDLVEQNGFKMVAGAAFVAQHSIFPTVAKGRPDESDMKRVAEFAADCRQILLRTVRLSDIPHLKVKGNRPYRDATPVPLHPKCDKSKCKACLACATQCPTGAIPEDAPHKTNADKCIACGRCTVVCKQGARRFGGLMYKAAELKLRKAFAGRKEPEFFLP